MKNKEHVKQPSSLYKELRKQVFSIIKLSEILLKSDPSDKDTDCIKSINNTGKTLLSLINDFEKENNKPVVINRSEVNVLVVDDSDFNLEVTFGLLAQYGIVADTASSGSEAIAKVKSKDYDIVFMDHIMPDMDGIEATIEIRKLGAKYSKLCIIALTANVIQGANEMFLTNGFDGFIAKPIDMVTFRNTLLNFLPCNKTRQRILDEPDNKKDSKNIQSDFYNYLEKVEEIDAELGLLRFDGNEDLYKKCLQIFFDDLLLNINKMQTLINAKDFKKLTISSHTIKSTLSSIGAIHLSDIALKIETAAKIADINSCLALFPNFLNKLNALHEQLSNLYPVELASTEKEKGDMAFIKKKIKIAIDAVNEYDCDLVLEVLNELNFFDFEPIINQNILKALNEINRFNYFETKEFLDEIDKLCE